MAPFINVVYLYSQHGEVLTCPVKCAMELLVHSQTSTVQPLKGPQVMLYDNLSSLVQLMACRRFDAKPLHEPISDAP